MEEEQVKRKEENQLKGFELKNKYRGGISDATTLSSIIL